jgi:hypothetical protein
MWLARSPAPRSFGGRPRRRVGFDCCEIASPTSAGNLLVAVAQTRHTRAEPRVVNRDRAASVTAARAEQSSAEGRCPYANSVRVDPAMPDDDGLDRLSSQELHDLAVRRAKRHLDARFFYQVMKLLPVAEAGAGEFEKSENDIMRLSAHVDDVTDSGRGEVAELMRPFYLEYLRKHRVTADAS